MAPDRAPIVEITAVEVGRPGQAPLRVARLAISRGDRLIVHGLDAGAAELFVHLMTGAVVPDAGDVVVDGRNTRDIATDREWLVSLDRFGLVTSRAVLLEGLSTEANLALPLSLSLDPIPADVRARVAALAAEAGLGPADLQATVSALDPAQRVRLHLGRALAQDPALLLLDRPAEHLDPRSAREIGVTIRRIAAARGIGYVALSDQTELTAALGGTRLHMDASTGAIRPAGFWRRLLG